MDKTDKLVKCAEKARLTLEQIKQLSNHHSDYQLISTTATEAIEELKEYLDNYYASLK